MKTQYSIRSQILTTLKLAVVAGAVLGVIWLADQFVNS